MQLLPHPQHSPGLPIALATEWAVSAAGLELLFHLSAPVAGLILPEPARNAGRKDELWRTTCFEAFVQGPGGGYAELNFAPSGDWAAYLFDGYRSGMRPLDLPCAPDLEWSRGAEEIRLSATIALPDPFLKGAAPIGICAVIEEAAGTRSYWALAHADGPPDFHHPDCFAGRLA